MAERDEYAWGLACLHAATAARCRIHDRHTARRLLAKAGELMDGCETARAAAEAFAARIGRDDPVGAGEALLRYVIELSAEMCAEENAGMAAGVARADPEFDWQKRADLNG